MKTFSILLLAGVFVAGAMARRPPVVFAPGLMGSRLEWKMPANRNGLSNSCIKNNDWHVAWAAVNTFTMHLACFESSSSVHCDSHALDKAGYPICNYKYDGRVKFRADNYGGLGGVRHMDDLPSLGIHYNYFAHVETWLKKHGWAGENQDIFAVPYDWRMSPMGFNQPNPEYGSGALAGTDFDRYKALVERVVAQRKEKVFIIGHSMGCLKTHMFLNSQSPSWVQKHVGAVLYLAPALAGSYEGNGMLVGGIGFGIIPHDWVTALGVTWPVFPFLAVNEDLIPESTIVARYGNRAYTPRDYDNLIEEIHGATVADSYRVIRKRTRELVSDASPAPVRTHIVAGISQKTPGGFNVTKIEGPGRAVSETVSYVDGDGTVPIEPLDNLIAKWSKDAKSLLSVEHSSLTTHSAYVGDKKAIAQITWPAMQRLLKEEWGIVAASPADFDLDAWLAEPEAEHPWETEVREAQAQNRL